MENVYSDGIKPYRQIKGSLINRIIDLLYVAAFKFKSDLEFKAKQRGLSLSLLWTIKVGLLGVVIPLGRRTVPISPNVIPYSDYSHFQFCH